MLRKMGEKAYAAAVGGLIALLMVIIVGVLVFFSFSNSITGPTYAARYAINNTTAMAGTVFSMLNILPLVVIAGIIIGVIIYGFASGKGIKT